MLVRRVLGEDAGSGLGSRMSARMPPALSVQPVQNGCRACRAVKPFILIGSESTRIVIPIPVVHGERPRPAGVGFGTVTDIERRVMSRGQSL